MTQGWFKARTEGTGEGEGRGEEKRKGRRKVVEGRLGDARERRERTG